MIVYGIEGEEFAAGEGLSPAVATAAGLTAETMLDDLKQLTREAPCTSEH